MCKIYDTWRGMLERCYSEKYLQKYPTYIGCSVAEEWHSFLSFRSWMLTQDFENKQLDKDLLVIGNKVYSKNTCVFLNKELNYFLIHNHKKESELPVGVSKSGNKYAATCSNPFTKKRGYIGTFATAELAHQAWKNKKHELAIEYSKLETDPKIIKALQTRFSNENSINLNEEIKLAWTDIKRAQAIESYTNTMKTEYDNDEARAAASVEVVKEIAEELGETLNGTRIILTNAGVYIKGSSASKSEAKAEASAPKRIGKAEAHGSLKTAIKAIDPDLLTDEGSELVDKMTAKCAAYFTEIILALTKE